MQGRFVEQIIECCTCCCCCCCRTGRDPEGGGHSRSGHQVRYLDFCILIFAFCDRCFRCPPSLYYYNNSKTKGFDLKVQKHEPFCITLSNFCLKFSDIQIFVHIWREPYSRRIGMIIFPTGNQFSRRDSLWGTNYTNLGISPGIVGKMETVLRS